MKLTKALDIEIVKLLYYNGPMTCPEISQKLLRSVPTINAEINVLLKRNMLRESGYAPSKGGRRAVLFTLDAKGSFILTIAVDQFVTRISILDLENRPVCDVQSIDLPLLANDDALTTLIDAINSYVDQCGIERSSIIGAGISLPGFFDIKQDINYTYDSMSIPGLSHYIAHKIGLPTFMDNDSSAVALAELRFGKARDKEDTMVINLGWGIGLGMVLNHHIFRGQRGLAGELSHIPLLENGELCVCGKRGCLEAEASLMALAKRTKKALSEGQVSSLSAHAEKSVSEIGMALLEAAQDGDPYAVQLISDASYHIGKALAILVHFMNPDTIVLSGRGTAARRIILAPIQQALNKFCIARLAMNMDIVVSDLGYDAQLVGGAALVMDHYTHNELNVSP